MKKFALKILKKSFIVFSIILLIYFLSLLKGNIGVYDVYNSKYFSIKNLKIGVYGDSNIKSSINTMILNKHFKIPTTQFAIEGQPLFYSVKQIENHIQKNTDLKIILDFSSNNLDHFSSPHLEGDLYRVNDYIEHLSNNYFLMGFQEQFIFLKNFPLLTLKSILKGVFKIKPHINSGVLVRDEKYRSLSKKELDILFRKRNDFSKKEKKFHKNFEVLTLKSLIEKHPNMKIVLYRAPEHKDYENLFKNRHRADSIFYSFNDYENVTLIDYIDSIMSKKYFADSHHLNNNGFKLINKMLLKDEKFLKFISE